MSETNKELELDVHLQDDTKTLAALASRQLQNYELSSVELIWEDIDQTEGFNEKVIIQQVEVLKNILMLESPPVVTIDGLTLRLNRM